MLDLVLKGQTGPATIELDACAQPFLADHRVGRSALLSTVMSIEAMAEAALALFPGKVIGSVEQLVKRGPVLVPDDVIQHVEVEVEVEVDADAEVEVEVEIEGAQARCGALRCRIISDPAGARRAHDEATLVLVDALDPPPPGEGSRLAAAGPVVEQEVIYGLFFHGPSFRVIGSARLLSPGLLVAELARDLPPLFRDGSASAVAPRMIELCLQAAGVLELASSGRMAVPHSIESIVRHRARDRAAAGGMHAVVRQRADADGAVFDARVLDAAGVIQVAVSGYRTVAYDQRVDDRAAAAIIDALEARPAPEP